MSWLALGAAVVSAEFLFLLWMVENADEINARGWRRHFRGER